jgi:hypothetical protein
VSDILNLAPFSDGLSLCQTVTQLSAIMERLLKEHSGLLQKLFKNDDSTNIRRQHALLGDNQMASYAPFF